MNRVDCAKQRIWARRLFCLLLACFLGYVFLRLCFLVIEPLIPEAVVVIQREVASPNLRAIASAFTIYQGALGRPKSFVNVRRSALSFSTWAGERVFAVSGYPTIEMTWKDDSHLVLHCTDRSGTTSPLRKNSVNLGGQGLISVDISND